MGSGDFAVTALIAWDIGDELVEEYSGFGAAFRSRGRSAPNGSASFFEWSTYDQTWRDSTLAALAFYPGVPPPYRNRMSVTPLLKFAITRQVTRRRRRRHHGAGR